MACGSKAEGRVWASRSRAVVKGARSPDLPRRLEGFSDLIYKGGVSTLGAWNDAQGFHRDSGAFIPASV